jgi:hypothetical protein
LEAAQESLSEDADDPEVQEASHRKADKKAEEAKKVAAVLGEIAEHKEASKTYMKEEAAKRKHQKVPTLASPPSLLATIGFRLLQCDAPQ